MLPNHVRTVCNNVRTIFDSTWLVVLLKHVRTVWNEVRTVLCSEWLPRYGMNVRTVLHINLVLLARQSRPDGFEQTSILKSTKLYIQVVWLSPKSTLFIPKNLKTLNTTVKSV